MAGFGQGSPCSRKNLERFGDIWMCADRVPWGSAFDALIDDGAITATNSHYRLTQQGQRAVERIETDTPLWFYEYNSFFAQAIQSKAHSTMCNEVYGKDLCQHGLVDMTQLNILLEHLDLSSTDRVLDAGSGNGRITMYLAQQTGAVFRGIDICPVAVQQAQSLAVPQGVDISFTRDNLNELKTPSEGFTAVISLDTLYFVKNLAATLRDLYAILQRKGKLGIFFTQWINAGESINRLAPDGTDLGRALRNQGLNFKIVDLTEHDVAHWQRKLATLEALKCTFEDEGANWLHAYRYSEALRYASWDTQLRRRYLYIAELP